MLVSLHCLLLVSVQELLRLLLVSLQGFLFVSRQVLERISGDDPSNIPASTPRDTLLAAKVSHLLQEFLRLLLVS